MSSSQIPKKKPLLVEFIDGYSNSNLIKYNFEGSRIELKKAYPPPVEGQIISKDPSNFFSIDKLGEFKYVDFIKFSVSSSKILKNSMLYIAYTI